MPHLNRDELPAPLKSEARNVMIADFRAWSARTNPPGSWEAQVDAAIAVQIAEGLVVWDKATCTVQLTQKGYALVERMA